MGSEWPVIALGEVATVRSGFAFKSRDWTEHGIPVVKIANVKSGRLEMAGCSFVDEAVASGAGDFRLSVGDILVAMTGYVGDVARVRESDLPCVLNQRVGKFTVLNEKGLDADYLFQFLAWSDTRQTIAGLGYGSAQPNVSPSLIHKIEIPLPPLPEQKRIAHILGTLDDKIELNRRMNATLEGISRAIFKSWFVDFDPVWQKAAGKQPVGMDAQTASLFPDSFEDSEIGEVPKGWSTASLGDHARCIKGKSYKSSELADSRTALVTLKSFARGGGYRPDGLKAYTGEYKPEQVVAAGDVVVACTDVTQAADVIGRPAIVQEDARFDVLVASLDVAIVCPTTSRLPKQFLYGVMQSEGFAQHTYAHSSGTTVLHLSREAIPSFRLVLPPVAITAAYEKQASALLMQRMASDGHSRSLAALRDTLLPKLLSGEIRVPEAEEAVEEAIA